MTDKLFIDPNDGPQDPELAQVWDALGLLSLDDEVVVLAAQPARSKSVTVIARWGAVAASMVAAVCAYGWWSQRPLEYETHIGEQRTVHLADGSNVTLNTNSRIEVRIRSNRREVALMSGEAFFDVAHKASAQPFYVVSGESRVRVTGTRFDVNLRPDRKVDVSLLQGHVRAGRRSDKTAEGADVASLSPGDAVRLNEKGAVIARYPASRLRIENWLSHRIYFDRTPLSEAVIEMNRYNTVPLTLTSPALGNIQVSGIFDAGDTESFARALHALHGVNSHHASDHTELTTN